MPTIDTSLIVWNPHETNYTGELTMPDEINVRDSSTTDNVPVGGNEAHDGDFLQAVTTTYAPLEFSYIGSVRGDAHTTTNIAADRKSTVVASALFVNSGASVDLTYIIIDKNDVERVVEIFTLTATTYNDGSYYHSSAKVLPAYGADEVKFAVAVPSSGNASISVATV
jgi:hypothetical protein